MAAANDRRGVAPANCHGRHDPRVIRGLVLLDENSTLFTLRTLTKANDADHVRAASTKLKDYDIDA